MGWGDEIMAMGQAETLWRQDGKRRAIVNLYGSRIWSEVWKYHPAVIQRGEDPAGAEKLKNAPGCRPYIQYPFTRESGCRFTNWRARDWRGHLWLSNSEKQSAMPRIGRGRKPIVVIEPHIAHNGNPNKQWGRWQELVEALDVDWVQLRMGYLLPGVRRIQDTGFRDACALLDCADAAILPEGALHHAAAALNVPAVVIFGGFISPETTGYPEHRNLFTGGKACGKWMRCDHCRRAMRAITVADVIDAFKSLWQPKAHEAR